MAEMDIVQRFGTPILDTPSTQYLVIEHSPRYSIHRPKYLFDEHLPLLSINRLREAGIVAHTIQEMGLRGSDDWVVLKVAHDRGYVLVTRDRGFLAKNKTINELWVTHGTTHAGIICLESLLTPGQLAVELEAICSTHRSADIHNRVLFL